MYKILLKALNIEKQEAGISLFLFISAVFLGGFLGSFDVVSHAIFFEQWSQADFPIVYFLGGVFGLILFGIYAMLHKRLPYKVFHFLNLSLIGLIVILYFFLYFFQPGEIVSFAGLVIMFPVNILLLLTFWRYCRKLLLPEQTKRIFPLIEFGVFTGIAIICLIMFFLLGIYQHTFIALMSLFSLLGLFLLQFPVDLFHRRSKFFNHKKESKVPVKSSVFILWTTKFTRLLLFFAIVSAVLGFYLHYGFINLFRIKFPEVMQFSIYYPIFILCLFLLIFLTDRLIIHKVLYSYDSPYSLALLPVGMIIVFIFTIFGTVLLRRIEHANPLPFLLLVAVGKMIYEVSRNTIQLPSFRTLYQVLDIRFLQIIYPQIEGTAVMFGMILTGIVIALLQQYISNIILFAAGGIILSILWFFISVKLIKRYKAALQESYKKLKISRAVIHHNESYTEKIRKILVGDDPVKVINAMRLSARIEPLTYEKGLQRMLANPQPAIQNYVLRCIEEESLLNLLPELRKVQPASDESEALLARIVAEFEKKEKMIKGGVDLEMMVNSRDVKKRLLAAEIIGSRKDLTYTSALVNLTREFEPDVKVAAVKAMARISSADHSYLLIELLTSPAYHAYAFEALVQIGDPALDYLDRLFINPNTDDKVLARALKIYGKVASPKAVELLLSKLENQSKVVTDSAISALHEANFQATSLNVHRILNIVVRTIHVIGWNYLIFTSLPSNSIYNNIKEAYRDEINSSYNLLFDILSLAYNARTINEIHELLEQGSTADISHAIEMLDHFVFEDIKPVLFPVIENIPARERVKRLQYYFPIESMDIEEMISSTLTRDYNILALYPRICALNLALTKPDFEVNQDLVSNLFHPNRLLREVAAVVVHKKDPEYFENVMNRLSPEIQFELRDTLSTVEKGDKLLLIEKFNLLRNTDEFVGMPEEILIEVSQAFHEVKFETGGVMDLRNNYKEYTLFILVSGSMQLEGPENAVFSAAINQLHYSNIYTNAGVSKVHFTSDSKVLAVDDETIERLLFDHAEIANCVLNCVEQFKLAV